MLILYILLGIIVWCLVGYISAYIDYKYDIVDGDRVNDNILLLTVTGMIPLIYIVVVILSDHLSGTVDTMKEKLKFKEKENK